MIRSGGFATSGAFATDTPWASGKEIPSSLSVLSLFPISSFLELMFITLRFPSQGKFA